MIPQPFFYTRGYMNKKIKLSIGLIVKNEEENLEKCLIALQDLRNGVESELVIADTGSSDRTVEIARRYADKLFFFEWCDDFAEARNFVLDQTQGEWFLQIDADEWLERADSLIEFLNSPEADRYDDVYYIMKNHITYSKNDFEEVYVKRLFRRLPERRYEGIVHEHVDDLKRIKYMDVYVDHYGYVQGRGISKKNKKNKRNLPLLIKELERNPDNLLMLYQLAQEYMGLNDIDMLSQTCKKIIEKYGSKHDDYYVAKTCWMMNRVYFLRGEYQNVIRTADEFLQDSSVFNLKMLDLLGQAIDAALRIEEYEKANRFLDKLFSILSECDQRKARGEEGFKASVDALAENKRERRELQYVFSLKKCGRYRESLIHLKLIKGILGDGSFEENASLWYDIINETKEYQQLCDYYCSIKQNGGNIEYVQKIILAIWQGDPEMGNHIAKCFLDVKEEDNFVRLQKVYYDTDEDKISKEEEIKALLLALTPQKEYSRLLYLAWKDGISISLYLERCPSNVLQELAYELIEQYPLFKKRIMEEPECQDMGTSIKKIFFYGKMQERLLFDVHLTGRQIRNLFGSYIESKMRYLSLIIRPELLTEEGCENLPGEYGFAVYSALSLRYEANKEYQKCLFCYRKALKSWPFMKNIIKNMMDALKEEIKKEEQFRSEFDTYAKKIKEFLWKLIQENNYNTAKETLDAYEKVNPSDREIEILKIRLNEISCIK